VLGEITPELIADKDIMEGISDEEINGEIKRIRSRDDFLERDVLVARVNDLEAELRRRRGGSLLYCLF
jgi:hypothetical protein